jgi:hypothetical protein
MPEKPVNTIIFRLHLLINIDDAPIGGTLPIEDYTFDPGLKKGDTIHINNWKVGVSRTEGGNSLFEFDATVMDIQKTVIRTTLSDGAGYFLVNILLESSEKEKIVQLKDAYKANNPQLFG